jgi:hypothetical protein
MSQVLRPGLLSPLIVVLLLPGCLVQGPTERAAKQLEEDIDAELPVGSSIEDAEIFLKKHDIEEYSYNTEARRLQGIKRGIWAGFPTEGAVQVRFEFGESERLEESEVEIVYTGP